MSSIAILTGFPELYSVKRLNEEALKKGLSTKILHPEKFALFCSANGTVMHYDGEPLEKTDYLIPRIGISYFELGLSIVRQFELSGTKVFNNAKAIAFSKDKFSSLQILAADGIAIPTTLLTRDCCNIDGYVSALRSSPAVIKFLRGAQGNGVFLSDTIQNTRAIISAMKSVSLDAIVQQFIPSGADSDIRVFIVNGKVIGAMKRTAGKKEFRSNIHCGGKGKSIDLPRQAKELAIRAVKALGLDIAGVDLIETKSRPDAAVKQKGRLKKVKNQINSGFVVIEVNSSPGFEELEKASGTNIARTIVEEICSY